jgi:hypothetical protein
MFPPLKNVSVPLLGLTSPGSLINDGGGYYNDSNITWDRVVKSPISPNTQLNDL